MCTSGKEGKSFEIIYILFLLFLLRKRGYHGNRETNPVGWRTQRALQQTFILFYYGGVQFEVHTGKQFINCVPDNELHVSSLGKWVTEKKYIRWICNPQVQKQNLNTYCLIAYLAIYNIHKKYTRLKGIVQHFGNYVHLLVFLRVRWMRLLA